MKRIATTLVFSTLALAISSCDSLRGLGKDNLPAPKPLVKFAPTAVVKPLWTVKAGNGTAGDYLKLTPVIAQDRLFTADQSGKITAINAANGQQIWQIATKTTITSPAAVKNGLLVVGGSNGQVFAIDTTTGQIRWRTSVSNAILATPALTKHIVIIKTIDGHICALNLNDGKLRWQAEHHTPLLILRASSAPRVAGGLVIAGFADGKLVAFDLADGSQRWETTIAIPSSSIASKQMVDIDVDPHIRNGIIYVASYQGNVAAIAAHGGQVIWVQPISSYAGLALGKDLLFVSDAQSRVWAFNRTTGKPVWRQNDLANRGITGPALMGDTVVVADSLGYAHWLRQSDGHFVAQVLTDKSSIITNPLVRNNILYTLTANGKLSAYSIN